MEHFCANFVSPVAEEIIQSLNQVRLRLISQLIRDISRDLQKLRKHFNGIAFLTFFALPSARVFSIILILDLNDSELSIVVAGSSL